jgi:hypothetical protein
MGSLSGFIMHASKKKIIAYILALAAVVLSVRWLLTDEVSVIKARLAKGAKSASFEGQIHPFERLAWAKEIAGYFSPECAFVLRTPEGEREILQGPKDLQEKLVVARSALDQFAFAILAPQITLKAISAEVVLTARGIGREPGRTDYFKEEHKLSVSLQKTGGEWQIIRVENIEPYEGELEW